MREARGEEEDDGERRRISLNSATLLSEVLLPAVCKLFSAGSLLSSLPSQLRGAPFASSNDVVAAAQQQQH